MSLSTVPTEGAMAEATEWFTRLKKRDVPASDMDAFQAWFNTSGNKEAYDAVDAMWRRSGRLKDDPDIQNLVASALERTKPAPAKKLLASRPVLGFSLALGLMIVLAGAAYRVLGPQTYRTEIGERRTIRLADGSSMTLDTNSRASVRLTAGRRDIRLVRGQALFEVAHDTARPFVVTAGATSVTALGTRFDVRRDPKGATVTLVRGAVEVREKTQEAPRVWRLSPGQRVVTAQSRAPVSVDVASATSWTTGRLTFHNVPLRAAVTEFNRYERRRIELEPGPWDEDRVSGAFDVGDTDTFVDSVAQLHDLTVTQSEKGVIRLTRAGDGDGAQ